MKKQSYQISYRFCPQGLEPHPRQLEATITIDGEPREYHVVWCEDRGFRPTGAVPNAMAVRQAVKRLTDWYQQWFQADRKEITIVHKNDYYGNDVYFTVARTEVRWEGFTWDSDYSDEYNNPSSHAVNSTEWQSHYCWVPVSATVEVKRDLEPEADQEIDSATDEEFESKSL